MDFISSIQLRAYEDIIDKIQSEHEKSKQLQQEIEKENNKLIITRLAKSNLAQKIAHINIKIFSDIVELFHLYRDEIKSDISSFFKNEDCKLYLVEIFITNSLYKKLKDLKWFLTVSVRYDGVCISRTIQGKDVVMPFFEVIPVNQNVVDCKVSATLILPTDENCFSITLDTVSIDISYHFELNKVSYTNPSKKIVELAKLYNQNFDFLELRKPLMLEYQFSTTVNSREFIKNFIQNCYHKFDLEYFSELGNDSKNTFVLKFSTGFEKHSISFDRGSNLITLKSNFESLVNLKNYFCKEGVVDIRDADKFKKNIKKLLPSARRYKEKEELCSLYIELRRFWTECYS